MVERDMSLHRRIVALYLDDAFSSGDDDKLVDDFIRKWIQGPKMKLKITSIFHQFETLGIWAQDIWQYTFSEPPQVKTNFVLGLAKTIESYIPLFQAAGRFQEGRNLNQVIQDLRKLPQARPHGAWAMTENRVREATEILSQMDASRGRLLYRLLVELQDFQADLLRDAGQFGWAEKVQAKISDFNGRWWPVWRAWEVPGSSRSITQKMPAENWAVIMPGAEPQGKTLETLLWEFSRNFVSDMSSLEQLSKQINDTANWLSVARFWAPSGRNVLDDLNADLEYVVDRLRAFMGPFPSSSPSTREPILGWLKAADQFLLETSSAARQTKVPRSAGQLRAAHEAFENLGKEVQKLANLGLRAKSFSEELYRRGEAELQAKELSKLEYLLNRDLDVKGITEVLDSRMDEYVVDIPTLDPVS